jgi:hypothetical protein
VTACLTWIQATSTAGLRPCLRSVAGCATPTGFAGHAGATTSLKLTFDPDHSVGANHVIGLAGVLMTALGLMSGAIRSSIPILIDRQLARVRPFTHVVVGDSLAALCPWKWSFGLSPVALVNLAVSGSDIRGMTHQIDLADQFRPQVILISGGLNDLISYEAPLEATRHDFGLLLRHLRK